MLQAYFYLSSSNWSCKTWAASTILRAGTTVETLISDVLIILLEYYFLLKLQTSVQLHLDYLPFQSQQWTPSLNLVRILVFNLK